MSLIAGFLWQRGWAVKNGGNISVNLTGEVSIPLDHLDQFPHTNLPHAYPALSQNILLVTGTGTRMRDVESNIFQNVCLLRILDEGTSYHLLQHEPFAPSLSPTSELLTHLAIHQFLKQQGRLQKTVLHTHPDELIAMTLIPGFGDEVRLNKMLFSLQPETALANPAGIGLVQYIHPGTGQLAEHSVASFQHHPLVLWGKHGCVAVGKDLQEAFDLIDVMNKSAQLFFLCRNAGFTPQGLQEHEIEALKKLVK
jgi:rhamnulose-1-phosphate aldolase